MRRLAAFLLVILATMPGPRDVTVDCDSGGDLARALRRAQRFPGTTIHVTGTCTGTFVVAAEGVSLQGDPAGTTVIQGPEDAIAARVAVLEVTSDHFRMNHVTVRRGWIGAHFRAGISTNSDVLVRESRFEDNYGGVLVDSGAFARIENSVFQSNQVGVSVLFDSQGSIADCEIRDSGILGIDVYDDSIASVSRTSVSGSANIGMVVNTGSFLGITDGNLSDNAGVHVLAQDRSKLQLRNTTLGSDTDTTQLAMFLDDTSILRTFLGESWGDVVGNGAVHLSLENTTLHGSLLLDDFTDASLSRTTIDNVVECRAGSDAFCGIGVTASVSGCASSGPPCSSVTPPVAPRARPVVPLSGAGFNALRIRRSDGTTQPSEAQPGPFRPSRR